MRYLVALAFLVVFASCNEPQIAINEPISLGSKPENNALIGYSVVNRTAYIKAKTTIGAKYSLQLNKLGELEPTKAQGFTATAEESNLVVNFDQTKAGIYDLILIDTEGNVSKLPLNIL
jgi:hypothetical protein